MKKGKRFTLEQAASFLNLSVEELISKSHEVLGKKEPAELTLEELENLVLKSGIRISVNARGRDYAFEFLRKEALDNSDVYFVLVEDLSRSDDSPFFLEVRVEKGVLGAVELTGILKNLIVEREVCGPSLVNVTGESITVSELFNDFSL